MGFAEVAGHVEVMRFEDMIAAPADFARRVCEGAGLDPAACATGIDAWAGRVQDTDNSRFVEARTSRRYSRADHARRVGRWRENLTPAQVRAVTPMVSGAARIHGYALEEALPR